MDDIPIDPSLKRKRQSSFAGVKQRSQLPDNQHDQGPSPQQGPPAGQGDLQQRQHLQVNYLARQFSNDLPLITYDDTCPNLISLLNDYNGVFDRHESMASNLGAPSTGPEWVRRFERMFDAPPRIVSHPSGYQPNVTWLDIVDFAATFSDHFNLSSADHVPRVCEIHIKDCDVVISEQDFQAIKSGGLQNMIPTQPVAEDEEKELGALQIVERSMNEVVHFADKVALRGRVFVRRLGERKAAIIERRAADPAQRVLNGSTNGTTLGDHADPNTDPALLDPPPQHSDPASVSPAIHDELVRSFAAVAAQHARAPISTLYTHRNPAQPRSIDPRYATASPALQTSDQQPAPRAHRPLGPHGSEQDGLFKAEMIARTEAVPRGQRIYPPCDRCRRLRTDCIKNLTACAGCTKKHAKCSWRDVKADELSGAVPPPLGTLASDVSYSPVATSVNSFARGAGRGPGPSPGQMLYTFNGKQQMPLPDSGMYDAYDAAAQGPSQHQHQHQQGYEPAYDPAFDEPDAGAPGEAEHDERDADRARIQAAARSLAMAAMHSHLADNGSGKIGGDEAKTEQQQQQQQQQQDSLQQNSVDADAGAPAGGDNVSRLERALHRFNGEGGDV